MALPATVLVGCWTKPRWSGLGAAAGDQIVAWPGGQAWAALAAARGDVVEICQRKLVEHGQGLRRAVQSPLAGQGSPLIGDGDEPGPLRSSVAGAAELRPGCGSPIVERIVDGKARIGVGVIGDVRVRP